jgi:hypothetical protein
MYEYEYETEALLEGEGEWEGEYEGELEGEEFLGAVARRGWGWLTRPGSPQRRFALAPAPPCSVDRKLWAVTSVDAWGNRIWASKWAA